MITVWHSRRSPFWVFGIPVLFSFGNQAVRVILKSAISAIIIIIIIVERKQAYKASIST